MHLHLLCRPEAQQETLERLLSELKVQVTDASDRNLRCSDLSTSEQFMRATVSRADLLEAIGDTFGTKGDHTDHLLILVPANNDGIRAAEGQLRRRQTADEIDKLCDAIFGSSGNVGWFLSKDRYDDKNQVSVPKPVFAGCDAHSFDQLERSLGHAVGDPGNRREITWVKADPTYEGLLQTLIEPASRVSISDAAPDHKEPYKYISSVHFDHAAEFPTSIPLNPNLVSIIGSRSSGKSALLAYIAHAVDPDYTITQQVAAGSLRAADVGPAAGKAWSEVVHVGCRVEWGDATATTGKIIYIPQNSLFAVSERPEDITAKIQPALYRLDREFEAAHARMLGEVQATNLVLSESVERWFERQDKLKQVQAELRDLGDPAAVATTRDALGVQIAELREASSLTEEDASQYQALLQRLGQIQGRLDVIAGDLALLTPYLEERDGELIVAGLDVDLKLVPSPIAFPVALQTRLEDVLDEAREPLLDRFATELRASYMGLRGEQGQLILESDQLRSENAELIQKNQANAEIEALVQSQARQVETLAQIAAKQGELSALVEAQVDVVDQILERVATRSAQIQQLIAMFESKPRNLDDMIFGVEAEITYDTLAAASSGFNRQENTDYFDRSSDLVDLERVLADPAAFLSAVWEGAQKIKIGMTAVAVVSDVLTVTPEVRFSATLEGDRIGGFQRSSMTPGKQALFALTLILNESTEAWPLLIDQPEDDLDSRSIWHTIVPYLMERKRDRQILMASHDANLVIGADSEQIVVANRHGADRQNRDDRTFSYMTGSLEHSMAKDEDALYILESCGIREHACDILDGGEDAFRKRKDKYNL